MYYVTTKTVTGEKIRFLGSYDKRDTARSEAALKGGTVRTEDELNKLIEEKRVELTTLPGYVPPEPAKSLVELAAEIKAKGHARRTVGKKEKITKRVATPEAVIAAGTAFAREQMAAGLERVALVRAVTGWKMADGARLQRRDMFAVFTAIGSAASPATISTQFQRVRAAELAAK